MMPRYRKEIRVAWSNAQIVVAGAVGGRSSVEEAWPVFHLS